jgi:ABC-type multidrug transport system fused ATPase/permease subunit
MRSSQVVKSEVSRSGCLRVFVAEARHSLSAGQKQLAVLARALLKRHKILVLDEVTASIDSATDAEISRVVHEEFKGATVLIIAHRLRVSPPIPEYQAAADKQTIMPCSKILVMDKGNLVQEGSPLDLIRQNGKFQELCMAGGPDEYRHLVALAEMEAKKAQLVDVDV